VERKRRDPSSVVDVERVCAAMELSRALQRSGDGAEALRVGREALPEMRRVLGDDNSITLNAMAQLASVHSELGDHAAALRLRTEALHLQRVVLGHDHPIVLAALEEIATGYVALEEYDTALPLLNEHLEICRRSSAAADGEEPEDEQQAGAAALTQSLSNLANCHSRMAQHAQALPLAQEAKEISARIFGSQHAESGYFAGQLGDTLFNLGDLALAVPVLEAAVATLSAAKEPFGDFHPHPLTLHFASTLQDAAEKLYKDGIEAALRELILSHADDAPKESDVLGAENA
jgi:tetratricopeptide (TPR) repeat protein